MSQDMQNQGLQNTTNKIDLTDDGNENQSAIQRQNTHTEFENQKISMGLISKSSKSGGHINYPAWVKTDPKMMNAHNNL